MHAYRAGTAFDGERLLPGGALVLVEADRIVAVEPGDTAAPDGCPVADFPDSTLLPGLIDVHVHLCGDGGPRALDQLPELSEQQVDDIIVQSLRTHVVAGTTTVRDLGDIGYAVLAHRHDRGAPTVLTAGPPLTSMAGHCAVMGGEVDGTNSIRNAIRAHAERGVDVIKIMTSGGAMTMNSDVTACQFTLDELRTAVDEAHRAGLPITGHAHAVAAVQMCVEAGVDGIEHCSCLTSDGFCTPPELVALLASSGIAACPTLGRAPTAEPPPHIKRLMEQTGITWDDRLDQVTELYRGGAWLVAGTDSGINPGKPHGVLALALADQVGCGMSTTEALVSATSDAARAVGLAEHKGRLRAGYDADLVVLAGNPIDDIDTLRAVQHVVVRGRAITDAASPTPLA